MALRRDERRHAMRRWGILLATVLLGIVPATFVLLANALYYVSGVIAIPDGAAVNVVWGEIVLLVLMGTAGVIGYVALIFAARARVSGLVAICLLLGVAALVYAIVLGLTPLWLGTPAIVGFMHAVSYFIRRRPQAAGLIG